MVLKLGVSQLLYLTLILSFLKTDFNILACRKHSNHTSNKVISPGVDFIKAVQSWILFEVE